MGGVELRLLCGGAYFLSLGFGQKAAIPASVDLLTTCSAPGAGIAPRCAPLACRKPQAQGLILLGRIEPLGTVRPDDVLANFR